MQNPMMTFKKWQYISIFYEVMHFLFGDFIFPSCVDGDFFKLDFYYVMSYILVLNKFELIFAYDVRKYSNLLIYS